MSTTSIPFQDTLQPQPLPQLPQQQQQLLLLQPQQPRRQLPLLLTRQQLQLPPLPLQQRLIQRLPIQPQQQRGTSPLNTTGLNYMKIMPPLLCQSPLTNTINFMSKSHSHQPHSSMRTM